MFFEDIKLIDLFKLLTCRLFNEFKKYDAFFKSDIVKFAPTKKSLSNLIFTFFRKCIFYI